MTLMERKGHAGDVCGLGTMSAENYHSQYFKSLSQKKKKETKQNKTN